LLSLVLSYFALAFLGLGTLGTAWARSIASVVGSALTVYVVTHYVPISFDKEALWKGSFASAFMVIVIVFFDLMRKFVSSDSYEFLVIRLQLLPIYIAVGGLAYFVALVALKALKRHDVKLIEGYMPRCLKPIVMWLERFAVAD